MRFQACGVLCISLKSGQVRGGDLDVIEDEIERVAQPELGWLGYRRGIRPFICVRSHPVD